ncbi:MAG TPA: AmmeMemoRadiSam system radical SAM enzyme [Thermoanaerobaculia bacterium]|nr:AmmeMemoRadiSam system radical SAM enzyme [Thermoanaerobaculia bacterium]
MTAASSHSLAEILARRTAPAAPELTETLPDGRLRCHACGHRCPIPEGREGVCRVRFRRDGVLEAPRGYVGALQCDPIEKKPFFHALPGSDALSFGMLGCDLHCAYCQNWFTSQSIRDPEAAGGPRDVTAAALVGEAIACGAPTIVSTYNEPLITSEWAVEVFREARGKGLRTGYVSNGNGTPRVLDYLKPWIDFYKVDLKSMDDRHYRELGGVLQNVLDTIAGLHERGIWLEVLTLVIPGFNDSDAELTKAARFIASVSRDVPWHVTAFHPDYKMTDRGATPAATLRRACEIGTAEGLRYVYAGNLPGLLERWENTRCPGCGETVIERRGFRVLANRLDGGACPRCATKIPGRWDGAVEGTTRTHGIPLPVL